MFMTKGASTTIKRLRTHDELAANSAFRSTRASPEARLMLTCKEPVTPLTPTSSWLATAYDDGTGSRGSKATPPLQLMMGSSLNVVPNSSSSNVQEDSVFANEAFFSEKVDSVLPPVAKEDALLERREQTLNKVIGVAILLNALVMGLELDYGPQTAQPSLADQYGWYIVESVFIVIFFTELVLRVSWEGRHFTRSIWCIVDTIVLIVAVFDIWVFPFVAKRATGGLQVVTMVKFARIVRLLRVVRLVRMFRALHVTIMAFKSAMLGLVYIGSITVLGLFMCSIFTTAVIGRNAELCALDLGAATGHERFGSIPRSMYSLFEIMTLEGWTEVARPLVMHRPGLGIFLCGFIMVFTFGLMNMIVANVVDRTIAESKKLDDLTDKQVAKRVVDELNQLKQVFKECDVDNSGTVNRMEFFELLRKPDSEARQRFEQLNIPCSDAASLFNILDADGDGSITLEELIQGIARLKGAGNPEWDMLSLQSQLRSVSNDVRSLRKEMSAVAKALDRIHQRIPNAVASNHAATDAPDTPRSVVDSVHALREREIMRHWTGQESSADESTTAHDATRSSFANQVGCSFVNQVSEGVGEGQESDVLSA